MIPSALQETQNFPVLLSDWKPAVPPKRADLDALRGSKSPFVERSSLQSLAVSNISYFPLSLAWLID